MVTRGVNFASSIAPLLRSPTLKSLHLSIMPPCNITDRSPSVSTGDIASIKSALNSNQMLRKLVIKGGLSIQQLDDLKMLLKGIAAAPKLRSLDLDIDCYKGNVSPLQASEVFANALKDCRNSTLKLVKCFRVEGYDICNMENWVLEVTPILQFNRVRRQFQENKKGLTHKERLVDALEIAQFTDNHHLRFWLFRNHERAIRATRGGDKNASSRKGKRKQITK
jgi:hypothetical protein